MTTPHRIGSFEDLAKVPAGYAQPVREDLHVFHDEPLEPEVIREVRPSGRTREQWSSASGQITRVRRLEADGTPHLDEYFFGASLSRLDGPARTIYEADVVSVKEWWRDNCLSRIDGPAKVTFYADGSTEHTEWWFEGYPVYSPGEVAVGLAKFPAARIEAEIRFSSLGVLLDEHGASAIMDALLVGVHSLEGVRAVLDGAPAEWVRSFEDGTTSA